MNLTSLRAKGVEPISSLHGVVKGWRLRFNVEHFFRHEGGMGNIEETRNREDEVHGVVHQCNDEALGVLDEAEAYGIGYDRIQVNTKTNKGIIPATTYVGYPSFINNDCMPTRRYLNILIKGAMSAELDANYIESLEKLDTLKKRQYPDFVFPDIPEAEFNESRIKDHPLLTAIGGAVFDMTNARAHHEYVKTWFGGKDMTLFHLRRMDSSEGTETIDDLKQNKLNDLQRRYLNEYLHEFNDEYVYAGRYKY